MIVTALVFLCGVVVGWLAPRVLIRQSVNAIPLSVERRQILIAQERGDGCR